MLSALSSFAVSFLIHFAMDAFQAWQAKQTAMAQGRAEAVADGAQAALVTVGQAHETETAAEVAHRADASDAAFDQDFKRST